MKKFLCILLAAAALCVLPGCRNPDSLRMDLSRGYGNGLKLLHLNACSEENEQRILAFKKVLDDAQPLDKDASLFAYYPDYSLKLVFPEAPGEIVALVDLNGEFVDFRCPESDHPEQLYRSSTSAREFKKLVHQS